MARKRLSPWHAFFFPVCPHGRNLPFFPKTRSPALTSARADLLSEHSDYQEPGLPSVWLVFLVFYLPRSFSLIYVLFCVFVYFAIFLLILHFFICNSYF